MLFCLTAQFTPEALAKMRELPAANRREAAQEIAQAAGGKVIDYYYTIGNGPGALVIVDIPDPQNAIAICGIAAGSGTIQNVQFTRLFTQEEVNEIRQKGRDLRNAYRPPGA